MKILLTVLAVWSLFALGFGVAIGSFLASATPPPMPTYRYVDNPQSDTFKGRDTEKGTYETDTVTEHCQAYAYRVVPTSLPGDGIVSSISPDSYKAAVSDVYRRCLSQGGPGE